MDANLNYYQQVMSRLAGYSAIVTCFVLPISTSATTILFALTALLVLVSGAYCQQWRRWLCNPASLCLLAYYAVILLGATYSIGSSHDISKALLQQLRVIEALLIMPVFFNKQWRKYAIIAFLVAMTLTVLASYVHYYIWGWQTRGQMSPACVFKDNIVQSFLMAIAIGLLMSKAIESVGLARWGMSLLIVLMLFNNFVMSVSRTGYVITFAVLLFWSFSYLPPKRVGLVCIGLLLLFFGLFGGNTTLSSRFEEAWKNSMQYTQQQPDMTTSAASRLEMLKRGWWLFKQSPVIGYGTGSLKQANTVYNQAHAHLPELKFANSNTIYLNAMTRYGVVGLILLFIFFTVLWWYAYRLPDQERYLVRVVLLSVLVGGLFNSWLTDFVPGYLLPLFVVISYSAWHSVPD